MNEHTKLPWKVTQYPNMKYLIAVDSITPDADGITHQICGLEKGKAASDYLEIDEHLANAEFIVQACNGHKGLQTLLEDALDWIEGVVEIYPEAFSTEIVDELKAAIASAKPEQESTL